MYKCSSCASARPGMGGSRYGNIVQFDFEKKRKRQVGHFFECMHLDLRSQRALELQRHVQWSSEERAHLWFVSLWAAMTRTSSWFRKRGTLVLSSNCCARHILNFKRFSSDYIVDVRCVSKLYKNSEESYKVDVYCHALGGGEGWQDVSVQRLISTALCNICGNNSVNQRQAREVCIFKVI
jgi:hypothetical protein